MAIMDYRLEFCDATSVGTGIGTTAIGNVIDLGVANKDYADGSPIYLHARMHTAAACAGTGPATLAFVLQEAASTTTGSFATILTLKSATAKTTYIAGYKVYDGALPVRTYKRYLRIASTIATSALAAGKIDAWLNLDPVS